MKKAIAFVVAVVLMFLVGGGTVAQDSPPPPTAGFYAGCIEALGETHYRIHFGYTADTQETFLFQMGAIEPSNAGTAPYSGHATTNVPAVFTTQIGTHMDFYLDAHEEDSPYTFHMIFTNLDGYADLPLNTWDNLDNWCNGGAYSTPAPDSTPEPTSAFVPHPTIDPSYYTPTPTIIPPADRVYWAYVFGNGKYYWSHVNEAGVVLDLPPVEKSN